jgi:hypothetical protein
VLTETETRRRALFGRVRASRSNETLAAKSYKYSVALLGIVMLDALSDNICLSLNWFNLVTENNMDSSSASFVLFTAGALLAGAGQAGAADAPYIFTDLDLPGSTGQAFARAISNGGLMVGYGPHIMDPFVYHAWAWRGKGGFV